MTEPPLLLLTVLLQVLNTRCKLLPSVLLAGLPTQRACASRLACCRRSARCAAQLGECSWGASTAPCCTALYARKDNLQTEGLLLPRCVPQVFDDPCPGQYKQLSLTFRCEPEANLPPLDV